MNRLHKIIALLMVLVYLTGNHWTFGGVPEDGDESVCVYNQDPAIDEIVEHENIPQRETVFDGYNNYLLAKIAMAEAGDQDTKGKALVIRVVLNRVNNRSFPDTVSGVIYQKRQFSPVLEGKFENVIPDVDCWKALDLVMDGWDESQGALYFKMKCKSKWHERNLRFLFKYQDHYFFTEK